MLRPDLIVEVSFARQLRRRRHSTAESPTREPALSGVAGRLPRITRLMALAIKFDGLLHQGVVRDYADLARLGRVTRARATQIMNLLLLASDIQETLLNLPAQSTGKDAITERELRPVVKLVRWDQQREAWRNLMAR